jgi:putative flippase GtrA
MFTKILHSDRICAQAIRYAIVGVSNTLIGLGSIFCLMYFFSVNPLIANILGYTIALSNSFVLNKIWTFKHKSKDLKTIFNFLIIFIVSYLIQLFFLVLLINLGLNPYLSQVASTTVYVFTGFIGNKFVTFKE